MSRLSKKYLLYLSIIPLGIIIGITLGAMYFGIDSEYTFNLKQQKVFRQAKATKFSNIENFYNKFYQLSIEAGNLEYMNPAGKYLGYKIYLPSPTDQDKNINYQLEARQVEFLIRTCMHSKLTGISLAVGHKISGSNIVPQTTKVVSVNCKDLENFTTKFLGIIELEELIGIQLIYAQKVHDMPNRIFENFLLDRKRIDKYLTDLPVR